MSGPSPEMLLLRLERLRDRWLAAGQGSSSELERAIAAARAAVRQSHGRPKDARDQ